MGAQTSKSELITEFNQISNEINQELSDFFGKIDGFTWTNGSKVDSMEKYARGNLDYSPRKSTMDSLKEERQVCQSIVLVYKERLNNLLSNSAYKQNLINFIKKKGIDESKIKDIGIKSRTFGEKNDSICDDVLRYYYLKYRLYRLLKNYDPYGEEYKYIIKSKEALKSKFDNTLPETKKDIMNRISELESARNEYQSFAIKYLKKLTKDPSYKEMENIWYELTKDNKNLKRYCNKVSNICDNITNFASATDSKNFKIKEESKNKQCGQVNLENYKQVSVCKSGRVRSSPKEKKKKEEQEDLFEKIKRNRLGGLGNRLGGLGNKPKINWDEI